MYLTCLCVVWQSLSVFFVCVCVTGLRILEVVFSLSLCSVCLRLQRHQGHVQWFRERDQTGNLKLIALGHKLCYAWFVLTQCCNVVPDVLTWFTRCHNSSSAVQTFGAAHECISCCQWKLPADDMESPDDGPSEWEIYLWLLIHETVFTMH